MSANQRESVYCLIVQHALAVCAASVCAASIDASDIRKASLEAMRRAVAGLTIRPVLVLADGRDVPPGLDCEGAALVKGDQRSQSIAAASIIAKVTRDRILARCGAAHPGYGFERHAGYGTKVHMAGIETLGALPGIHRMSFSPLRRD
jgi:ribonuclease HII